MAFFSKSGTIHVPHNKNTSQAVTEVCPVPAKVYLPMQQHIGAPATLTVKEGDTVYVGTLVGKAEGYISSDVHSSVSGKVVAIEDLQYPGVKKVQAVVVESDGKQTQDPSVKAPEVKDYDSFVEAVKNSGLVGLGGAGFPTFVKLSPKNLEEVKTLIVNGAECEPYITADEREMLECADEIAEGIALVKKYLNIDKVIVAIEDNKPEAIALIKEKTQGVEGVQVEALQAQYPQGAEKVLVKQVTGKEVPRGGLPADVGVLVMNVATIAYIAKYLATGMPVVKKRITIDGDAVNTPKNAEVLVGTPIEDVIAFCGGYKEGLAKIVVGGPMMGTAYPKDSLPLKKTDNAVLCFSETAAEIPDESSCIHCGSCVAACPMSLSPVEIIRAYNKKNKALLENLMVDLCMECGSCAYVCPAKVQFTKKIKLAKVIHKAGGKK